MSHQVGGGQKPIYITAMERQSRKALKTA